MNRAHASYGFLGSVLFVTLLGRWFPLSFDASLYVLMFGGVVSLLLSYAQKKYSVLILMITLGTLLGLHTADRAHDQLIKEPLRTIATDQKRTIVGEIDAIPDRRPTETRYIVKEEETNGRILVFDRHTWPEFQYGDRVEVTGTLRTPEAFDTFDYPAYLKTQNIHALMSYATIESTNRAEKLSLGQQFFRSLYGIRIALERQISLVLPEPHSSLLIGFITGSRSGLSDEINEEFRKTGTSHIVAVSGYNVTLVLAIASSLLFWLPLKKRFLPLVLGILAYMLLTGAGAPVVRASIMGFLGLLALQSERQSTPRLSLLWTAVIMTLIDPIDLWFDPGFQLSFLAVLGITELTPLLNRIFKTVPKTLGVRESLIATVAAQIATLPVSVLTFKQFSVIAPITNLLIAPMIPLSMAFGMLGVSLSLLSMPLGLVSAYISWAALEWILQSVHLTSQISWAQMTW